MRSIGDSFVLNTMCSIPVFKEFNENEDVFCEFLEHDLKNNYDGIIGNNILKRFNAIVDYPKQQLILNKAVLKLYFDKQEEIYDNLAYNNENVVEINFNNEVGINNNIGEFIESEHLSEHEKGLLYGVLKKFKRTFYNENDDLSFTNEVKHHIHTKHELPVYSKLYRYPEVHRDEVDRQIEEMLKQGIIRESNSPFNSPIWVVPKKEDLSGKKQWRIVIDYRKLNEITIEDRQPMPNIEEIFDKLGRCQYFTTLDLAKGFHQIEMHHSDIHKTAFSTSNGHYEFLRMPFGLRNAPATFQRLINNVLKEYIGKICLVYLDDILIFSTSIEEHMESLSKILKRLREANLKIQLNKCQFMKKETAFLGHVVTPDGIKTNPKKVEAIDKIPLPSNQKEIKSFLGITGYYRRFIKDYSKVAHHLVKYLKKNTKVNKKDKKFIAAFHKLKELIKNDPILVHPDFKKKFTLVTDASNYALGAVLTQDNKAISFASRSLNDHEKKYSTIEKELLAIVWATKHFRPYLYGRSFVVKTDHKPLVWLNSLKEPNMKLQRWKIKLNEFDFIIEYIKGKENVVADGLSRINYEKIDNADEVLINLNEIFDDEIDTVHSADTDSADFISITEKPLNIFKYQFVLKKSIRESTTKKIIFKKKIRTTLYINSESNLLELMRNQLPEKGLIVVFCEDNELFLTFQNNYVKYFSKNKNLKVMKTSKVLEDLTDKEKLLKIIEYEHLKNNHRGINEIFLEMKANYYYPNLQKEIQKFINNCNICNSAKFDRMPIKHKFNITDTPTRHNDIVHVDIWFPMRNVMYLTTIDKLTKYATAHLLEDRTWISITKALKTRMQYLGKPKLIVTDNELDTVSIRQFLTSYDIQLHVTTPYLKTGNADIERLHSTFNEHIRLFNADPCNEDSLDEKVFKAVVLYNNTIHTSTKMRPIDFINNIISEEEITSLSKLLHANKTNKINKLNENRETVTNFENEFVRNNRIGKSNPKYINIKNYKQAGNHLISDKHPKKSYKNQVKRKTKFQNYHYRQNDDVGNSNAVSSSNQRTTN